MGKVFNSFEAYDSYMIKQESRLPCCCECGDTIYEDLFDIEGELFCEDCMLKHKKPVERYLRW